MWLSRATLLLLGVALGGFVRGGCCGSSGHSLSYFYLKAPEPSQGLPQFFIQGSLDDQPIAHFDSLTRKMVPLVPWMEEETETFLAPEWVFRADLERLSKLNRQTGGLHTWQVILGCDVMEDGSKGGFLHYGYNGRDFISFDTETLRWVAAQPQAEKVKEEWDHDPEWSQRNRVFLEETCIEQLQRYLSYRKEALQRAEPPVGKVTHKAVSDNVETLICQAYGFYPKEINATWRRDGEVCKYETFHRNVAPNSDGTYYVWFCIEIDPKDRDRYQCHVEHDSLQEPLVLAWKEKSDEKQKVSVKLILLGVLVTINVGLGTLLLLTGKRRHQAGILLAPAVGFISGLDVAFCVSNVELLYQVISGIMAVVCFLIFVWFLTSLDILGTRKELKNRMNKMARDHQIPMGRPKFLHPAP